MNLTINLKSGLEAKIFENLTEVFGKVEISIYNDDYIIVTGPIFEKSNNLLDSLIQFTLQNQPLVNKAILSDDKLTFDESVELLHCISLKGLFYTINPVEGYLPIDAVLIDENLWFVSLMSSLNFYSENTVFLYEKHYDYYNKLEESETPDNLNTIQIYNSLYGNTIQKLKAYYNGNN
jgi:hypothetical protein